MKACEAARLAATATGKAPAGWSRLEDFVAGESLERTLAAWDATRYLDVTWTGHSAAYSATRAVLFRGGG